MALDQGLAFLLFALVAAITPGPSNAIITATGAAVGMARGLPCVLGAALGMASLLFCAALGLGRLLAAHPGLLAAMNWCGAGFLLWLAWRIATAEEASASAAAKPVGFVGAALFQWINPKGWLVATGAAGTYLHGTAVHPAWQAAAFAALFFLAALPSGLAWLVLGAALHRLLRDPRTARIFNAVMGALLAASVAVMLL